MLDTGIWVVQYLRTARLEGGIVHRPEQPRIYRIIAFSGDTVWGINIETDVLTKVNRTATDGSGRIMNMQAFDNPDDARSAAERITAEINAEQAEAQRKADADTAEQLAAKQALYPAVLPTSPNTTEDTTDQTTPQTDTNNTNVQVGVSLTIKPGKPAKRPETDELAE